MNTGTLHLITVPLLLATVTTASSPAAPPAAASSAPFALRELDSFGLPSLTLPVEDGQQSGRQGSVSFGEDRLLPSELGPFSAINQGAGFERQERPPQFAAERRIELNEGSAPESPWKENIPFKETAASTQPGGVNNTTDQALFALDNAFLEYVELTRHTQTRRKGPFYYSLRLNSAAIFDDNITLRRGSKKSDMQLSMGPSGSVQLGSDESDLRVAGHYAGSASWFLSNAAQRTYEQKTGLEGAWNGSSLKAGFRTGLQSSHNSSLDAGERVGRNVYYAGGGASYGLSEKTSAELNTDITRAEFNGLIGSTETRLQGFLNHQITPKLQLGAGATEGSAKADGGKTQTYTQALLRAKAQPTGKLSLNASAGNEWRTFDTGEPGTTTPVFSLGASWQATGRTSISMEGRRRTFTSAALTSQNYTSSDGAISIREMLTSTVDASLTVGMEKADYHAASPGVRSDRTDNYWFARYGIDWAVRRYCTTGVFYEFSKNESTGTQSHSFTRNRLGVSLALSF